MKVQITFFILSLMLCASLAFGEELPRERQQQIIENYLRAMGRPVDGGSALSETSGDAHMEKCGTPAILQFQRNRDKLDPRLVEALGANAVPRPVLTYSYDPPGGNTRIHYNKSGSDAVYQAGMDSDGDGVPDYVESIGFISEQVYDSIFTGMGYPAPVSDLPCAENGGDGRTDIYLAALPPGFYGLTYSERECGNDPFYWEVPGWIIIDNDFQHLPEYLDRPLDAARVTIAHEIYHIFHFAMDDTEPIAWFEMSAVWMEEQQFDDVNDYYLFDHLFYDQPYRSLQDTLGSRHYATGVWPIYLSEKYSPDIVRDIWMEAALRGPGQHWLVATQAGIQRASNFTADFYSAMAEFSVWNFFTGPYASHAPDTIGFSEAANYESIELDSMDWRTSYRFIQGYQDNFDRPEMNGAMYLRLDNLDRLDSVSWVCNSGSFDNNSCVDSSAFLDSILHMMMLTDTVAQTWGLSGMFQYRDNPERHDVKSVVALTDSFRFRSIGHLFGDSIDFRPYRSITFAFTPVDTNPFSWELGKTKPIGYQVRNWSLPVESGRSLPPSVLTPYPNPAVIAEMNGVPITFRFQSELDDTGYAVASDARMVLDIYTLAGERIRTIDEEDIAAGRSGSYQAGFWETSWDMKTDAGKVVAAGAYLVYARLFQGEGRSVLMAEDRTKVAIFR